MKYSLKYIHYFFRDVAHTPHFCLHIFVLPVGNNKIKL